MEHKYVRFKEVGFIVWPRTDDLWHSTVGKMYGLSCIISAGFCWFDKTEGKFECYGHSESLGISSLKEDTDLLNRQFGIK